MRPGLLLVAALALLAGCTNITDDNNSSAETVGAPGDPAAPDDALIAAIEPLWDSSTYLEVMLRETRPRLRWRERGISIRAMGQRPMLVVQEEEYSVDPAALLPAPRVVPPADGSQFWTVEFTCRRPGCLAVESKGSDGALSERRGANIWLARDEPAARRLAAALATVIAPPAG